MKKWVFSAVAYLIVVVVVYYGVVGFVQTPEQEQEHSDTEQH